MENDDTTLLTEETALPSQKTRRPMRARKRTVLVEGKPVEVWVYTTGTLAQQLERTHQTVRAWERDGVIPKALYRDSRGRRLFTEDQVKSLVFVFATMADGIQFSWSDSPIPDAIKALWDQMPEGVWPANTPQPWKEFYNDEA